MYYLATEMAKKLDISRSYLYYLKNKCLVNVPTNSQGHLIWDDNILKVFQEYLNKKNNHSSIKILPKYETFTINNRRYLGNKYKLIPFIKKIINQECKNISTIADIFAGTGSVASAFTDKKIITNDNLYSNYICHIAWFDPMPYSKDKIANIIQKYNSLTVTDENYMSINFANTYFSENDCKKIGYIREDIEKKFENKLINERERALLVTSLLYGMDRIANTCGHYDSYRQGISFDKSLKLSIPTPVDNLNTNNTCYNVDTNELVKDIEADLVYIDPPYNSRQYCDSYHLLENVATWKKPEVFGIAKKMNRNNLKSKYCTNDATETFEKLIENIHSKYILLSYNNMAKKGNSRSNSKILDEDILRILEKKGNVKVFTEKYKAFSTGKSSIQGHEERLFLCICNNNSKKIIPSALNYTGGKYKLLPQLIPFFPKNIDQVIDIFCGGCSVGINLDCNKVLFNDINKNLIGLLNTFKIINKEECFETIFSIIKKYNLSLTHLFGYNHYKCNSMDGLVSYNKSGYQRLRNDFNNKTNKDSYYFLMLYVLIVYAFNNQIRFNMKGLYNLPVGKRDFNLKMQEKLSKFIDRIKSGDYSFSQHDFKDIALDNLTNRSFIYADPPYLITTASYNEQNGWTESNEYTLLQFLDKVHSKGIKFALSNVIEHKGKHNVILEKWISSRPMYKVINLNFNYNNSNYHSNNKKNNTSEVLIINY